jgi:hypothetical protein
MAGILRSGHGIAVESVTGKYWAEELGTVRRKPNVRLTAG